MSTTSILARRVLADFGWKRTKLHTQLIRTVFAGLLLCLAVLQYMLLVDLNNGPNPNSSFSLYSMYGETASSANANANANANAPIFDKDYGFWFESEPGCTVLTHTLGTFSHGDATADVALCVRQWLAKGGGTSDGSKPKPIVDPAELARPIQVDVEGGGSSGSFREVVCDVPCRYSTRIGTGVVSRRIIVGTPWKIIHSMEGSRYYSQLAVDHESHKSGIYYSTTSFMSEIPLPYYSMEPGIIDIQAAEKAVNWSNANQVIHGASFLAKNCGRDREKWVRGIINGNGQGLNGTAPTGLRVDSLSLCMHNAEPPPGVTLADKWEVMKHYLFHLSFENGRLDDYITEKLWGALASGTVPVYYGAPNIHDHHLPAKSIIVATDFSSPENLGQYLANVASNRTLYESHHVWRRRPLPSAFVRKYNMTNIHSECRTCRWAYAKKFGLEWNHVQQDIVRNLVSPDSIVDRMVCAVKSRAVGKSLLIRPFLESWHVPGERSYAPHSKGGTSCMCGEIGGGQQQRCAEGGSGIANGTYLNTNFSFKHARISRYVITHDSVVDFFIRIDYDNHNEMERGATNGKKEGVQSNNNTHFAPEILLRVATSMKNGSKYYFISPGFGEEFKATRVTSNSKILAGGDGSRLVSIQNNVSRLTVMTDFSTHLSSPHEGTVDIAILSSSLLLSPFTSSGSSDLSWSTFRRMRFVLEDPIHFPLHFDAQDGTPTHFCNVVGREFFGNTMNATSYLGPLQNQA